MGVAAPVAELDPVALRAAFGAFTTGVTVAATLDAQGAPVGFTANSFSSVSMNPPLLLVCLGRNASSRPAFHRAAGFAVNILSAGQVELARGFASRAPESRFDGVAWRKGMTGAPLIEDCVARFDCDLHEQVEAGDHVILIGRVMTFDHAPRPPLIFAGGRLHETVDAAGASCPRPPRAEQKLQQEGVAG